MKAYTMSVGRWETPASAEACNYLAAFYVSDGDTIYAETYGRAEAHMHRILSDELRHMRNAIAFAQQDAQVAYANGNDAEYERLTKWAADLQQAYTDAPDYTLSSHAD